MPKIETIYNLYKPVVQLLLDIYTEQTNLPVAFYHFEEKKFIWSKNGINYYSPLCLEMNGRFPDTKNSQCDNDHIERCKSAKGKPELCHMGLWNIALPIKQGNKEIGALISGQRRLKDEKSAEKSYKIFREYLEKSKPTNRKQLEECFNKTPEIEQKDFDTKLLVHLKNIQEKLYSFIITQDEENKKIKNRIQQLAHEFLLPIQSITANAENLYHEVTEKEQKEMAQDIVEEMKKLANFAENMRSSLIEAKEQTYHFEPYDVYSCLIKCVRPYRKEAEKKGIIIHDPFAINGEKFPEIEMHKIDLTRAFENLIHNTVKYSFSGYGRERFISIIGEPVDNYYCISISNYGVGILPEEITSGKIFEEGYRGELSTDRYRTGSGIGLSEVKKIIKKHNGKIEITSEHKGGDAYKTTVKVFLPIKQNKTKGGTNG